MKPVDVLISEVGPRDGLQNCRSILPTRAKLDWIFGRSVEVEPGSPSVISAPSRRQSRAFPPLSDHDGLSLGVWL